MATGEPFFHWTAESVDARRCQGLKVGSLQNGARLAADATTINGVNAVYCDNGTGLNGQGSVLWHGGDNVPDTQAISTGARVNFAGLTAGENHGIIQTGGPFRNLKGWFGMQVSGAATPTVNLDARSEFGITAINNNHSVSLSTGVWYDFVFTWTGDTTTNGVKLWIDGVNVASYTASRVYNPQPNQRIFICTGQGENAYNARFKVDELFIYDSVIDPSSVTFRDGTTGSLNGASRTKYLFSTEFEGAASGGGGGPTRKLL